jgi:signal peptidase I
LVWGTKGREFESRRPDLDDGLDMRLSLGVAALGAGLLAAGCGGTAGETHTSSAVQTRIYLNQSSAMEPTLHCAKGPSTPGCLGRTDDRMVVRLSGVKNLERGAVIVFRTPRDAAMECGEGGTFVKRVMGLPGETVHEDGHGFIDVDGKRLAERYISAASRLADTQHFGGTWHVPKGDYFVLGDNRAESCDSRVWGGVPARRVIGPVIKILRGGQTLPVLT